MYRTRLSHQRQETEYENKLHADTLAFERNLVSAVLCLLLGE